MRKKLLIALSLVLVLVAVPLAYADMHHSCGAHGDHGEGFGFLGHLQHMKAELNLTDDQSGQIKAIAAQVREQNGPSRGEMKKNLHDAATLLLNNPADIGGAQAILDRDAAVERQMKSNMLSGVSRALLILTPDQRAKLSDLVARRMNRG